MTTPANPSNPKPADDDQNLVPVDPGAFEEKVSSFWEKNRTIILVVCVLVVAAIVGRGVMGYMAEQKELDVEKAYAAATTPEQIKSFIAAHPDHSLAGIGHVRLADEAYKAGKFADAAADYDKAFTLLKTGPLAARAQMGRALAKIQSGQTAAGQADLKQIKDDANQFKSARAEATYHLATVALEAGNTAEASTLLDEVVKLDETGSWMQRAMLLRMSMPAAALAPVPAASAPATPAAPAAPATAAPASSSAPQIQIPGR